MYLCRVKEDDTIISGFEAERGVEAPFAIDFTTATRLHCSGSTSDAYLCTVQRRQVFVKRLKEEFRDNPLYRAAFDKEFDLGVSLWHPSLPHYLAFGVDYIVMDYIEGNTLADLIKSGDQRIKNKRNIRKILEELIDVVEYLHNRNVVHCDIKPDNILISPYPDRPLMLIDLDKAYTSWLDTTHGDPQKYGCNTCEDGQIDFKAIGLIAEQLGLKRFGKKCFKADATADYLRARLHNRHHRVMKWGLIAFGAAACAVVLLLQPRQKNDIVSPEIIPADSAAKVNEVTAIQPPKPPQPKVTQPPRIDTEWISALIAEKNGLIEGYRNHLWAILDCDTIPIGAKRDAIVDYTGAYGLAYTGIMHSAVRHFWNISELDVQMAVRTHPAWIRLEKEEAENRARVLKWDAKVSQRRSDRQASQPDTVQGDTLPAPRR